MKTIRFLVAALLAGSALVLPARAAETVAVRAVLIMASNTKGPADPRLAEFEAELQRNLPESSFRFVREGSAKIADGGRASIALGGGDSVDVIAIQRAADGIHMKLRWTKGGMSPAVVQQPGVPVVLGRRPAGDGETPIVLVIAK